jgi:hypothetical protein
VPAQTAAMTPRPTLQSKPSLPRKAARIASSMSANHNKVSQESYPAAPFLPSASEVRISLLVERCDRNHDRLGKPGVGLILKFRDGRVRYPSRHCFAFKRQIGWRRF